MILRTMHNVYVAHFSHKEGCSKHPIPEELNGMRIYKDKHKQSKHCHSSYCYLHEGHCVRNKQQQCVTDAPTSGGWAHCIPSDQFVKAKGRKIAFTRAVKAFPINLRAELWIAYLSQIKEGKKIKREKLRLAEDKAWRRSHRTRAGS
jgi:hypothetical protein